MTNKKENWYQSAAARRWASLALVLALLLLVVSTKSDNASALANKLMAQRAIAPNASHKSGVLASAGRSSAKAFSPEDLASAKLNLDLLTKGPVIAPGDARLNVNLLSNTSPAAKRNFSTDEFALLSGSAEAPQFGTLGCVSACSQVSDFAPRSGGASFAGAYGYGGAYASGFFGYPVGAASTAASTSSSSTTSTTGGAGSNSGNGGAPVPAPEPSAALLLAIGLAGIAALGLRGKSLIPRN